LAPQRVEESLLFRGETGAEGVQLLFEGRIMRSQVRDPNREERQLTLFVALEAPAVARHQFPSDAQE
jgi:hypothetical protein